jgi:DNA-binding CsgD family transcriptional regulator
MAVAGSGGFVGRAEELARLLAALDQAEQGQPAMVLVAGDAGVGKTRLVAELAHQARQRRARVLVGGCLEVGDVGLPYVPVVAALRGFVAEADNRELLAAAAKGLPRLGRLLPELPDQPNAPASLGEGLEQLQLFDGVGSLLVRLSEHAPLVLVLEDLHWADASTRELVAFLHQTLRTGRLLLVATYRSDELQRRHPLRPWLAELGRRPGVARLELGPLSRAELAEHLASLRGQRLSAAAVERIFARSEGNPFYAEELLAVGADQTEVALPRALGEVLLARVQVLSEGARQVLRVAAVAGRRVRHRLLVAAAGRPEPEVETGLREAVAAGVLVAEATSESYSFRHALLQEAVYGDLLPSERVRLHATFAQLLEDGGGAGASAAELAYHCLASHDLAGGLVASVQAATEAQAVHAPGERLRHLEHALSLWERVPEGVRLTGVDRIDLVLGAAAAANDAGEVDRAVGLARQAIAEVDEHLDPLRAARARERLAHYVRVGHDEEVLQLCQHAEQLVPRDPPIPLRARVTAALAQALANTQQREKARRWCQEALAAARATASVGDEADVLITLSMVEALHDLKKGHALLWGAQQKAASAGHYDVELRAIHNRGWAEHDLGDLAAASATYDEGVERAWQVGLAWSPFGLAMRGGRCYFRYLAGEWDAAATLAAAVDQHVAALAPQLAADALAVEVGRGEATVEERLASLTQQYGTYRAMDIFVALSEAEQALWQDELERANSAIQRGRAAVGGANRWTLEELTLCAIGLAVQARRAEQARASPDGRLLAEAVASAETLLHRARSIAGLSGRIVHPSVHVPAWLAKAEAEWTRVEGLSDPDRWHAAARAFSFGFIYEVARCQWRLAEALLGTGRRNEAAEAAREAYQTAVRLGAAPLRAALEALGRRARLDLGEGSPSAPRAVGLTPREVEVLRLLMTGKGNRQIAEALFISGKTVSVHVTNILAKLGVHSRLEAAARARELSLDRLVDSRQR